jgi:hypothetical protein
MKEEGLFRVLTTGVLLGIAGAALFDLAKSVLELMLSGVPYFEAAGYTLLFYLVALVVALVLAGLAIQASVSGFAIYALPVAVFAIATTFMLLLGATYIGLFGPTDSISARQLWGAVAAVGFTLFVLGAVDPIRRNYGLLLAPIGRRLVLVSRWLTTHATWTLVMAAGAVLMVLGLLFGR